MEFKIIISPRAQQEIDKSIDFYALESDDSPLNFIISLEKAYTNLVQNPFLRIRYRNIRGLKLKKFPFLLYFKINENQKTVKILSCFHTKRSPLKSPKG